MDHESDKIERLEDRIEQLEATIRKMLPGRREALGMGVAGLAGASLMSGTASAGSAQVGTIGDSNNLVDVEAEDIDVSDTLTTQDIVVNGSATGPFGGGGIFLEAGDTITVEAFDNSTADETFVTVYNGPAVDVLGGTIASTDNTDFLYTFSDSTTLHKNGTGTSYTRGGEVNRNSFAAGAGVREIAFLPPAKDVIKIEVGGNNFGSGYTTGCEVILKV